MPQMLIYVLDQPYGLYANSFSESVVGVAVTSLETVKAATPGAEQTCPESFTCPENNDCSYTMSSCMLSLSCGVDFYGGNIDNQYAESLEACTQACAANSLCAAASYVGGKRDGRCHPKGIKNGASLNSNVEGMFGDADVYCIKYCADASQVCTWSLLSHPHLPQPRPLHLQSQ